MRQTNLLITLCGLLAGCSQPPQERPSPSPGRSAPTLTVSQIGQNSFGSAFRSASVKGDTASFVLAAPEEGTPAERYRRTVIMAATAIPTTLRNERNVNVMRFTVVDAKQDARKLIVFTVSKEDSKVIGGHGSPDALLPVAKVEFADPEYNEATSRSSQS